MIVWIGRLLSIPQFESSADEARLWVQMVVMFDTGQDRKLRCQLLTEGRRDWLRLGDPAVKIQGRPHVLPHPTRPGYVAANKWVHHEHMASE